MRTASTLWLVAVIRRTGESQSVMSESMGTKPEPIGKKKAGSKRLYRFALALSVLLLGGISNAQYQQYPVMEGIATRVIQKYQQSSCEQLWQQRGQPRSQREQEAVQMLRDDPQMRAAFINRVAAPIANKMFECGLVP